MIFSLFEWKLLFSTLWIVKIFVDCKLEIDIFKNLRVYSEGILYKNSFPVKYSRLNIENEKSLCWILNYEKIHAISYPKKLNEEKEYVKINCSLKNCQ